MKAKHYFLLLAMVFLTACASPVEPDPGPTQGILPAEIPAPTDILLTGQGNADVTFVRAGMDADGTWKFDVTVSHPDTGWEDYADGWDVVLPDGTVVKPSPDSPFTRLLAHPHENEQPFTRSQSGITIPEGIIQVTVRAHDLVDGFGGLEVKVDLTQAEGINFEVETPISSELSFITGLTYLQPDGNRYIPARIDLSATTPVMISLPGVPIWIVGMEEGNTLRWLAALEDGSLFMIESVNRVVSTINLDTRLPAGMPLALAAENAGGILSSHIVDQALYTNPVLSDSGTLAYLNPGGDLVLTRDDVKKIVEINALPDSRILKNGSGQFLLLTDPTNEYSHAVLGDGLEAKSATIVTETGEIGTKILAPVDMVFEAIQPIWADIDQDGVREIILTASNDQQGAQILVYDQSGQIIARGNPIGTGYCWRNQAAVAPFGPNGELELVNVITPHLFGKVEFLQLHGDRLERVAEISGYTSHVIGTRNLDMVLSADLDADGLAEVLLPTQDLYVLGIIKHQTGGAEVQAEIPLDGRLSTNLSGIDSALGLAVAAGTEMGTIFLWLP